MKKIHLIIFLALFFIFQVSALEIAASKDEFMHGETFQATLTGNILKNIQKTDVGFYIANVQQPITYDLVKINNTYYIYGILPYNPGNYSLKISKVYFKEQNTIKTQDIKKDFLIGNQTAEFYINPGFIVTTDNFKLILHNNKNTGLAVIATLENETYTAIAPPQDNKEITINIDNILSTRITQLFISSGTFSYSIPVYIIKNQTSITPGSNVTISVRGKPKLDFILSYIDATLNTGDSIKQSLELVNKGDKETGEINISVSDTLKEFVNVSAQNIQSILPGQRFSINFTGKFTKQGNFSGFITASSLNSSDYVSLNFKIGVNITRNSSLPVQNTKSCSQLQGKICLSSETCTGSQTISSDGFCCIGQCKGQSEPEPQSRNWIFIAVIIIILVIVGAFLFFKYKKPKTSSDVLKQKEKSFSERFETKGNLTKV